MQKGLHGPGKLRAPRVPAEGDSGLPAHLLLLPHLLHSDETVSVSAEPPPPGSLPPQPDAPTLSVTAWALDTSAVCTPLIPGDSGRLDLPSACLVAGGLVPIGCDFGPKLGVDAENADRLRERERKGPVRGMPPTAGHGGRLGPHGQCQSICLWTAGWATPAGTDTREG